MKDKAFSFLTYYSLLHFSQSNGDISRSGFLESVIVRYLIRYHTSENENETKENYKAKVQKITQQKRLRYFCQNKRWKKIPHLQERLY